MEVTIVEVIKGMLAPGIMISACGLLLLGMNNKYSLVVNRIRTLNNEFRQLNENDQVRKESITTQIPLLIERMRLIRNAVWLYTIGIAMFIFSIFCLGIYFLDGKTVFVTAASLVLFIIALVSVLFGVLHAAKEVRLGYKILLIETKGILKGSKN
ncbi:MAG: DUF2721 domain-containing protein [Cytophagales bacterium]|nr:DUF2721 domain-containing protein [Cytophagales bacterium]